MYVLVDTSAANGKAETHTFSTVRQLFFWATDKFRESLGDSSNDIDISRDKSVVHTAPVHKIAENTIVYNNTNNVASAVSVDELQEVADVEEMTYTVKDTLHYPGPPVLSINGNAVIDGAFSRQSSKYTNDADLQAYVAEREKAVSNCFVPPLYVPAVEDELKWKIQGRNQEDQMFATSVASGVGTNLVLNVKTKPDLSMYSSKKLLGIIHSEDVEKVVELQTWFTDIFCDDSDGVINLLHNTASSCSSVYYCYMLFLNFPTNVCESNEFIDDNIAVSLPKYAIELFAKYSPDTLYKACKPFGRKSIIYDSYFRNYFSLLSPLKFSYQDSVNNYELLVFKTLYHWYSEFHTIGQEIISAWVETFIRDETEPHPSASIQSSVLLTMFQNYVRNAFTHKQGFSLEIYKALDFAINYKTVAPELKRLNIDSVRRAAGVFYQRIIESRRRRDYGKEEDVVANDYFGENLVGVGKIEDTLIV